MLKKFRQLRPGEIVTIYFPRGSSVTGKVEEVHKEAKPWMILRQPNASLFTVRENEISFFERV